jgi:diaminopimelate decarboxylase
MVFGRLKHLFFRPSHDVSFDNFPDISAKRAKIKQIVTKYKTPLFLIDREIVLNRFTTLSQSLQFHWGDNFRIAYSFKTNYELAKSKLLKRQGVCAEVVSGHEYAMAKTLGYSGSQIIFNGPVKRDEDLLRAFHDGALVHVDNFDELLRTIDISKKLRRIISIGIRINTSSTGIESRFGFSSENGEVRRVLDSIKESNSLSLTSLHVHLGSDVYSAVIYKKAIRILVQIINSIKNTKPTIKYIDIGGGFPGHGLKPYQYESWHPLNIGGYIQTIAHELLSAFGHNKHGLIIEPGRYLIDDAGVFITKVYSRKIINGVLHILTDGAITMVPLVYYRPQRAKAYSSEIKGKTGRPVDAIVYGGTCKEDDVLYRGGLLDSIGPGDYIVYSHVGAYNQSMGSDFIFGKPKSIVY